MVQYVINIVGGIEGFGIISICLFVAVFSGALLCAFCHKKPFLNSMGAMPLQDDETRADEKGEIHHD